jgi:uncharacterized membrane protein YjfL (UPF0719 family)
MEAQDIHNLTNSLIYSGVGVIVLIVTFALLDLVITKYDLWKEIVEKQNIALAIFLGAGLLGLSSIIAAAIHG